MPNRVFYTEVLLEPLDYVELYELLGGHCLPEFERVSGYTEALLEPLDYRELYARLALVVP